MQKWKNGLGLLFVSWAQLTGSITPVFSGSNLPALSVGNVSSG